MDLPPIESQEVPGPLANREARNADLAALRKSRTSFLYFVRCNEFLKVGISTSLGSRISTMQGCNPYPIHVMATVIGGQDEEQAIHNAWRRLHHRGEWFRFEDEPRELCEVLAPYEWEPEEGRKALGEWWLRRHGSHVLTLRPMIQSPRIEDIDR